MKIRKIISLVGSAAICLAGLSVVAGDEPEAKQVSAAIIAKQPIQQTAGSATPSLLTTQPRTVAASAQFPQAPPAPPGLPGAAMPAGAGAGAAPAAAATAPGTLWTFLGFPSCAELKSCCAKLKECLGIPCPPSPLGAAANLLSPNPAVKAAAGVKAEQDAKPAKIKAIRYMAKVENACCYPGVREAFLAALDDCDWEIREEAAKAFGKACCCSPDVIKRLQKIVNEQDAHGHYKEPYEEVRCAAQKSLEICMCRCRPEGIPGSIEAPKETPEAPREAPGTRESASKTDSIRNSTGLLLRPTGNSFLVMNDPEVQVVIPVEGNGQARSHPPARTISALREHSQADSTATGNNLAIDHFQGFVVVSDKIAGVAHVALLEGNFPPQGARAQLYHKYPLRTVHVGEVEVVGMTKNENNLLLIVRPTGGLALQQLKKGDKIVVGQE